MSVPWAFTVFVLMVFSECCQRHPQKGGTLETTTPTILITVTGGRDPDQGVLAAWPDGVLVWSDDSVRGGPPYHIANVDPAAIARSVDEMIAEGRWLGERRFGPDAHWTQIIAHVGSESVIDVGSWHEILEANPSLVVTAGGAEPLDGRSRVDVLARQTAEEREFRRRWELVKARALALIPASGRPAEPADRSRMPWEP